MTTINGGGRLNESQESFLYKACGIFTVTVFREFIVRRDAVEVTMYFYKDGDEETKYRLDIEESREVLDKLEGMAAEWYMVGRIVEAVNQGAYRGAHDAVR